MKYSPVITSLLKGSWPLQFEIAKVHTRSLRLRVAVVTAVGVAVLKYLVFVVAVIIAVELEQD